jgi:outer membrane lipoprotein-sorting protein
VQHSLTFGDAMAGSAGVGGLAWVAERKKIVASFGEVKGAPDDTRVLKFVPRRPERDYDWLVLVVDRKTFALRMLVTADQQGGTSTFTFTNLKENVGLADREFTFKIPRGVEVVTQGNP